MIEKIIYSGKNAFLIDQIKGILKENNIGYFIKQPGAGQYLSITGYSNQETLIVINQEDEKMVQDLIKDIIQNEINSTGNFDEKVEDDEDVKKYNRIKKIGGIIFMLPFIATVILMSFLICYEVYLKIIR